MKINKCDSEKYTFPKKERLNSKKTIDTLFLKGLSFHSYPFFVRYLPLEEAADCHQFMVSVSKKKIKRSVDRHRVKRRVRESYRLNKHMLSEFTQQGKFLAMAYIYTAREIHDYAFIESRLVKAMEGLKQKIKRIEV